MLKLKGKYAYDLEYYKDSSALIIPKTAKAVMVDGANLSDYIRSVRDPFDFCLRAKVPRSNKLVMRWGEFESKTGVKFKHVYCELTMQKITRYFASLNGGYLVKIKPQQHVVGQSKRANKLTDKFFNDVMEEIGLGVHDERIHTKNRSVYEPDEENGITARVMVTECNNMKDFNWNEVNYQWYENKIKEILI